MAISGFGVKAGVDGFMGGVNFVRGIQRQDAQDAERRANRDEDIAYRNKMLGIQQENRAADVAYRDKVNEQSQSNRKDDVTYRNETLGIAKSTHEMTKQSFDQKQTDDAVKRLAARYEVLTTGEDGNHISPQEMQSRMPQLTQLMNELPHTKGFLGAGEHVDKDNPLAGFVPTGDGRVMFELNAKKQDGSTYTAPLTSGRSNDPNDAPVAVPLEYVDQELRSVFAGHGYKFGMSRADRQKINAEIAKEDRKHQQAIELKAAPSGADNKNTPSSVTKQDIESMKGILKGAGVDSGIAGDAAAQSAMVYKQAMKQGMSQQDAIAKIVQGVSSGTTTDVGIIYDSEEYDPSKANFSGQSQHKQPPAKQQSAPASAVNYLKQNPGMASAFKAKYGYLPEGK